MSLTLFYIRSAVSYIQFETYIDMIPAHSFFHTTFLLSEIPFLVCACLLFSNMCSPNSWTLLHVSDQSHVVKTTPVSRGYLSRLWAPAAQVGNILFLWHKRAVRTPLWHTHGQSLSLSFFLSLSLSLSLSLPLSLGVSLCFIK